jgi:hypothetical protein
MITGTPVFPECPQSTFKLGFPFSILDYEAIYSFFNTLGWVYNRFLALPFYEEVILTARNLTYATHKRQPVWPPAFVETV